jgi:hypothetical protein
MNSQQKYTEIVETIKNAQQLLCPHHCALLKKAPSSFQNQIPFQLKKAPSSFQNRIPFQHLTKRKSFKLLPGAVILELGSRAHTHNRIKKTPPHHSTLTPQPRSQLLEAHITVRVREQPTHVELGRQRRKIRNTCHK